MLPYSCRPEYWEMVRMRIIMPGYQHEDAKRVVIEALKQRHKDIQHIKMASLLGVILGCLISIILFLTEVQP